MLPALGLAVMDFCRGVCVRSPQNPGWLTLQYLFQLAVMDALILGLVLLGLALFPVGIPVFLISRLDLLMRCPPIHPLLSKAPIK